MNDFLKEICAHSWNASHATRGLIFDKQTLGVVVGAIEDSTAVEFGLLQFQLLADLSATGTVCITCVIYTGTFHLRRGQNQNHKNGGREEAKEQEVVPKVQDRSTCKYACFVSLFSVVVFLNKEENEIGWPESIAVYTRHIYLR